MLRFLVFALALPARGQVPDPLWRFSQDAEVAQAGWVRLALPLETMGAARADLADLRLRDPEGAEVSYLLERRVIEPPATVRLQDMRLSMTKGATVVTGLVPPASRDYDAVVLHIPAAEFLKAVTLEVSEDGAAWRTLAASYPIFRRAGEGESTGFEFPRSAAPYLRLTLDDAINPPVPVEGITLRTGAREVPGVLSRPATILQNSSDARQTELALSLPAENLLLNSLTLQTPDPAFSRTVTVLAKTFADGDLREAPLGSGTVWRLSGRERTTVPLRTQAPGSTLVVRIANGDNRPLSIQGVQLGVIPAALVFHAPRAGRYRLWSGHPGAAAPDYDVGALREKMEGALFGGSGLGPLAVNPEYRAPEALPGVAAEGGALDVSSWRYRKAVSAAVPGLARLELDPEVLSRAQRRLADLRLMRGGVQIPYILDAGGVSRTLTPEAQAAAETPKGFLTRGAPSAPANLQTWRLKLPFPGLPITRLLCAAGAGVFSRRAVLYEDRQDDRGDTRRRILAQTQWVRTQAAGEDLTLELAEFPRSDLLVLEVESGDNRPIPLERFRVDYQSRRLLFKASPGGPIHLYYGQPAAGPPVYDLSLVAGEVLSQKSADASLGPEETLQAKPWWEAPKPEGPLKYAFWAVLALVTGGLILVIAKLLPEER